MPNMQTLLAAFVQCMSREIIEGYVPGTRVRGRPWTTWQDSIKTWTGLLLVEAVRASEDLSQWRKIIHDAAKLCAAKEG